MTIVPYQQLKLNISKEQLTGNHFVVSQYVPLIKDSNSVKQSQNNQSGDSSSSPDNNPELKPKKKRTNKGYQPTQLEKKQLNMFGVHCEKHFHSNRFRVVAVAVPEHHREQTHDILADTLRRYLTKKGIYAFVWELQPDKSFATGTNWYTATIIALGSKLTVLDISSALFKKFNKEDIEFEYWKGEQVRDIIKLTGYLVKHRDNARIKGFGERSLTGNPFLKPSYREVTRTRQAFAVHSHIPNSIKRELKGYTAERVYNATGINLTELRRSFMQAFPDIKVDWDENWFALDSTDEQLPLVIEWFNRQLSLIRWRDYAIDTDSYGLMIKRMFWEPGITFAMAEWFYSKFLNGWGNQSGNNSTSSISA